MEKVKEWFWRYIPAEVFATIGAICGAGIFYLLTENRVLSAFTGTIGENIGYYGFISIRDLKVNKRISEKLGNKFGLIGYLITVRNLVLEFGLSETLDSFLIRPFCMYWFPVWMSNFALGIFTGKIIADIIFYIPTIISYELRKKFVKDI